MTKEEIKIINMKNIFLLLSLSFFIIMSCNDTGNNNSDVEDPVIDSNMTETLEDKVMKVITNLPEYNDAAVHVKAMTNNEQSLSSIIEVPNEYHTDYYIQVGYNQESWFEPYYHFYVNPETFEISVEDVIDGDVVPIETWRNRESKR